MNRAKLTVGAVAAIGAGAALVASRRCGRPTPDRESERAPIADATITVRPPADAMPSPPPLIAPGQARATVGQISGPGTIGGRVVNSATGDGVDGAELTFLGDDGAATVHTGSRGDFVFAPPHGGRYSLAAIAATGFLPYAPQLRHSTVSVEVVTDRAIHGLIFFITPAIDYQGIVIDDKASPVAGAKVRLLHAPAGEQTIDGPQTQWVTDKGGEFRFHAADEAVLEASYRDLRGWGWLDGDVAITKRMTIRVGRLEPLVAMSGRVVARDSDQPIGDALVRGESLSTGPRSITALATTDTHGRFTLVGVGRGDYRLTATADGFAPGERSPVAGGTKTTVLALERGALLAGAVSSNDGDPIAAFTIAAYRRDGARRELVVDRSIVDPEGRFALRIARGDYELVAAAYGWATSEPIEVTAPTSDARIVLAAGAIVRGRVVATDGSPVAHARIIREGRGGGASPQPVNTGAVSRTDGGFELAGVRPGPFALSIYADGYHPKIEAGLTARDGDDLGPLTIELQPLRDGEVPRLDIVGIGARLSSDVDALVVDEVMAGSGAEAAGIVAGDRVVAVDGIAVTQLGLDGAIARIRGREGTTVAITLDRGGARLDLVVSRRRLRT